MAGNEEKEQALKVAAAALEQAQKALAAIQEAGKSGASSTNETLVLKPLVTTETTGKKPSERLEAEAKPPKPVSNADILRLNQIVDKAPPLEEAIKALEAAMAQGGTLHNVVDIIPENAPKLTGFLVDATQRLSAGVPSETVITDLRDALQAGVVEFPQGKKVLMNWVIKEDRPDLFLGAAGGLGPAAPPAGGGGQPDLPYANLLAHTDTERNQLPDELKQYFDSVNNQLQQPERRVRDLESYRDGAKELAHRLRLSAEEAAALGRINERFDARITESINAERRAHEVPNRIYLTKRAAEEFPKDPIGVINDTMSPLIDQILRSPDHPAARAALNELELYLGFFVAPEFDMQHAEVYIDGLKLSEAAAAEKKIEFDKILDKFGKKQKNEFLVTQYNIPLKMAQFHEAYTNASDLGERRFQDMVNSLSERDFFGADNLYGGLLGKADRMLMANYEKRLRGDDGKLLDLRHNEWIASINETKKQMKQMESVFGKTYIKYRRGEFLKLNPKDEVLAVATHKTDAEILKDYDKACDSIVELARIRALMWHEKNAVDVRGLSPMAGDLFGRGDTSLWHKDKVNRIKRHVRYHMEVWGSTSYTTLADRAFMAREGEFIARSLPELEAWANDSVKPLWDRIESARHGEIDKKLRGEIQHIFFFHHSPEKLPAGNDPKGWDEFIRHLNKKELTRQMTVFHGVDIADSHLLRPYFLLESGWRRDLLKNKISERLYEMFGEEGLKRIYTSKTVLGAVSYYEDKFIGDNPEKKLEFLQKMAEASRFRPHDLAKPLYERENEAFLAWFERNKGGLSGGQYNHAGEMFYDLTRYHDLIADALLEELHLPPDYTNGLAGFSQEQLNIINDLFAQMPHGDADPIVMRDTYFTRMQELSKFMDKTGVQHLADVRYEPLLSVARWNDLPLMYLENPDYLRVKLLEHEDRFVARAAAMEDSNPLKKSLLKLIEDAKDLEHDWFSKLSDQLTEAGTEEKDGPGRRTWRDLGAAEMLFKEALGATFYPDEENMVKAMDQIKKTMTGYQGEKHAYFAIWQQLMGWSKMAEVFPNYGALLQSRPKSSPFRIYYGKQSISMEPAKIDHVLDEVQSKTADIAVNAIGSSPGLKGLVEVGKGYLNITNWRKTLLGGYNGQRQKFVERLPGFIRQRIEGLIDSLNDSAPLGIWRYKIPLVGLGTLVFLAVYGFQEAEKKSTEQRGG